MGSSAREPGGRPPDPRPAFAELTMIMLSAQPLSDTLSRVAHLARQTIPGVAEASITLIQEGAAFTMGSTGPLASLLDGRQYDAGFGPCMDAARSGGTVAIRDTSDSGTYPDFGKVAYGNGITHTMSVALPVERRIIGALNMYGRDPGTFDEDTEELATAFASYAAVAVANAGTHAGAPTLAAKLQEALDSRGVIDQAKGVLMAEHRYSADAAFAELVRRSRRTNRTVRDIAQDIVDDVQRGETQ